MNNRWVYSECEPIDEEYQAHEDEFERYSDFESSSSTDEEGGFEISINRIIAKQEYETYVKEKIKDQKFMWGYLANIIPRFKQDSNTIDRYSVLGIIARYWNDSLYSDGSEYY